MHPRLLGVAAVLAVVLTACGSDDQAAPASTEGAAAEAGALPVTIEHKFGSTSVEETPQRIVVAGLREQDSLLALGIVPAGTTEWYGNHPGAIFPWAEAALGDAPRPEVLDFTDGIEFEKIAGLRPDLILAVYSGLTKKDYDTLSKIAPTIARAAAEHPEFKTQTAAVATPYRGSTCTVRRTRGRDCSPTWASRSRMQCAMSAATTSAASSRARSSTCSTSARTCGSRTPARPRRCARTRSDRRLKVRTEGRDVFLPETGELVRGDVFHQRPEYSAAGRRAGAQARRRRGRRSRYRGVTSPRRTSARSNRTGCSSWS